MSAVRRCPGHGFFASDGDDGCPDCGTTGEAVLDGDRRRRLSKFLSGALRHFPDDVGLSLDEAGWTPYRDVVAAVERTYDWADERAVAAVVATDPKGRFERDGGEGIPDDPHGDDEPRIRAAYGHSVDVDLEPTDAPVPATLYHGTDPENLAAIRAEGLKPMGRQQVHLSGSVAAARQVGRRHAADPVVLEVDADGLAEAGYRVVKRGRSVYTTDRVPPEFLAVRED